jgi:two-component system probable response regulator PhcQ
VVNEREIATLVARFGMGNQLNGGLLLVDDEPNNLVVLRGFLEDEERWRVHTAASGDEALAVAEKVPLDVVVTDHRMPGMTGVDLLERLRRLRPDVAGIVLTGYADMDALEAAINRANAFRFLKKPWEPADILDAWSRCSPSGGRCCAPRSRS